MYDIRFPNLGIVLKNIKDGFTIFGFEIKFYGVIIALGFVLAFLVISKEAKRTGQSEDTYLDFMLWLIIPAILGARLYYIIFSWDSYFQKGKGFGKTLFDLIDIRSGGLAIYGGDRGCDCCNRLCEEAEDEVLCTCRHGDDGTSDRTDHGTLGQLLQPGSVWRLYEFAFCDGDLDRLLCWQRNPDRYD